MTNVRATATALSKPAGNYDITGHCAFSCDSFISVSLNAKSPVPGGRREARQLSRRILKARVYDVARRNAARARARAVQAPAEPTASSSARTCTGILVQAARCLQQDGRAAAFAPARGVIAASAGNHDAGAALAPAQPPRLPRGVVDARDHPAHQGRRGAGAGRAVSCARRSYAEALRRRCA